MKLTPDRIDKTLTQFEAQPVPGSHPAMHQFNELFGEHTFFLYGDGLSIIEPSSLEGGSRDVGQVVKLASWTDESHKTLIPHPREMTGITVEFGRAA